MRDLRIAVLLVATGLASGAFAQDPRKPGARKPDPKVWMCRKGPLLWEEAFQGGKWSKEWSLYKGSFTIEKGRLKVGEIPTDGHMATMTRSFKESNIIIQFGFEFDGARFFGIQLDDATNDARKEHVAQLTLQPDAFRIEKMTGFAGTTKNEVVDQKKMKFDPGVWHTMVWELQGDEMVATVDDKDMVMARANGMTPVRTRLQLISSGQSAWFDDIKIWRGDPDPKWPKRRAFLQEQLKK